MYTYKSKTPESGETHIVDMLVASNLEAYASENNMTPESYRADPSPQGYCGENTGSADEKLPGTGYPKGS